MGKVINTITDAIGLKLHWDLKSSMVLKEATHKDRQIQKTIFSLMDLMEPDSILIMMKELEEGLERMKNE